MQPSPTAETSRLLLPSVRFRIVSPAGQSYALSTLTPAAAALLERRERA
jgi:hypothetical protein